MKALLIAWFCGLTLYSPVELTRLIVNYGLESKLIFELCVIWVGYLIAMVILIKVIYGRPS